MIDEIQVQNLALISKASLRPAPGMTVLTGETGAGKTALLTALQLLMGGRGDKEAVREGSDALVVEGRFFDACCQEEDGALAVALLDAVPSSSTETPGKDGLAEDGLVVSRRVSKDGRSRVSLDGHLASVKELAKLVAPRIDLCGQHEHQQLMVFANHVHLLDAWAGEALAKKRKRYQQAFTCAEQAAAEVKRVQEASAASSAKLEEARFVLDRIAAVNPREGEYEDMLVELSRAEHTEALAVAANTAHEALSAEGGALDTLGGAAAALEEGARFDEKLGAYAESLREAGYVLEDVARETRDYAEEIEFDPTLLAGRQQRLSDLQGLIRAYGPRIEDVLARRDEASEMVSLVDDAAVREQRAQKAQAAAEAALVRAAAELDKVRQEAAPRFSKAVCEQMSRLEMGKAQLICGIEPLSRDKWTKTGPEAIEFLFRPGAAMQTRPLTRIASGGEISRVMLAIKVVLGNADGVDTLVFDEVDAGVGGSAAVALADVLSELAQTHQVIVVTHVPQVAVRGQAHYVVRKKEASQGIPQTVLHLLSSEERPLEIARMLSGDATETSLAHALEMLEKARN